MFHIKLLLTLVSGKIKDIRVREMVRRCVAYSSKMGALHQNPFTVGVDMYDCDVIKKYFWLKIVCVRDWVYALPRSRWSGISLIINKGMLTKNCDTLCRLLLQDGSIASKSVQGGCWHVWYLGYKEIFFKNSKFIRVEICRDHNVLYCART